MEPQKVYYKSDQILQTQSGNKISKKCLLRGSDFIMPAGKSKFLQRNVQITIQAIMQDKSILRGDLALIKLGKYVILMENVTLRPAYKKSKGILFLLQFSSGFIPISIGNHVMVYPNTIISAVKIGSNVQIGKNCIIGHRCVINDNVVIQDDSVIPPDTVVPSFCVKLGQFKYFFKEYGGIPANFIAQLPENSPMILAENAKNYYYNFVPEGK